MPIESSSWCPCSLSHDLYIAVFSVLNQLLHMWLKLAGKIIEKLLISSLSLDIFLSVFCSISFPNIKPYYFISWDLKIKCFLWRVGYCISTKSFFVSVFWKGTLVLAQLPVVVWSSWRLAYSVVSLCHQILFH